MIIGTGFIIMYEMYLIKKLIVQQFVQIEQEENEVVFFLLSFSDLSHHRTCGSAYGGSYFGCHSRFVPIKEAYPAARR